MQTVKTVGASGQICLGKEHAGRTVVVEELEDGVWLIKAGRFVPDSEQYLHQPQAKGDLDRSLAYIAAEPPRETDLDALEQVAKDAIARAGHGE